MCACVRVCVSNKLLACLLACCAVDRSLAVVAGLSVLQLWRLDADRLDRTDARTKDSKREHGLEGSARSYGLAGGLERYPRGGGGRRQKERERSSLGWGFRVEDVVGCGGCACLVCWSRWCDTGSSWSKVNYWGQTGLVWVEVKKKKKRVEVEVEVELLPTSAMQAGARCRCNWWSSGCAGWGSLSSKLCPVQLR